MHTKCLRVYSIALVSVYITQTLQICMFVYGKNCTLVIACAYKNSTQIYIYLKFDLPVNLKQLGNQFCVHTVNEESGPIGKKNGIELLTSNSNFWHNIFCGGVNTQIFTLFC